MASLMGLLSDPRMADIATGLLAHSGYSATPVSLGQAFGGAMQYANQRDQQRVELDLIRSKIADQQQKQQAAAKLQSLFVQSPGAKPVTVTSGLHELTVVPGTPPSMPYQTPQGQAQMMGLLAQMAPEQVAAGLLAQKAPRSLPSDLETYALLNPGQVMGTPQFEAGFNKWLTDKRLDPNQQALYAVQKSAADLALENAKRDQIKTIRDQAREENSNKLNINENLQSAAAIADKTQKLEGTMLESGMALPQAWRNVAGGVVFGANAFGLDASRLKAASGLFDATQKEIARLTMQQLSQVSGNNQTDAKLQAIQSGLPNMKNMPYANYGVVADVIDHQLDVADINGYTIPDAAKYRKLSQDLRAKQAIIEQDLNNTDLPTQISTKAKAAASSALNNVESLLKEYTPEQIQQAMKNMGSK